MSGTTSQAVILRARIGAYRDARRKNRALGSTISVWFEACDEITDELRPVVGVFSAIYWLPTQADFDSQAQPIEAILVQPGQWRVDVPAEMVGTYAVQGTLVGSGDLREAAEIQFDISTLGAITITSSGEIPWSAVASAGAAAGASAGVAAGREAGAAAGTSVAGPAALAAIAPARAEIEAKRAEVEANASDAAASEIVALGAADVSREERLAAQAAREAAVTAAGQTTQDRTVTSADRQQTSQDRTAVATTVQGFNSSNLGDLADKEAATANLRFRAAGSNALQRSLRDKLRERVTPEDYGAVGDGITDDTAAFVAMRTANPGAEYVLKPGRTYLLNDFGLGSGCALRGTRGSTIKKVPFAACAIRINSALQMLSDLRFEGDVFDVDGNVDPAKAGVSSIASATETTLTVEAGHGSRFRVGMHAFFESAWAPAGLPARGAGDSYRITGISGDTLTFNRSFYGAPNFGAKIIADTPLVDVSRFGYASTLERLTFRNFIVGLRSGSIDGTNAGNSGDFFKTLNFEQFTGAAIIQAESMATEKFTSIGITGSHNVRKETTAAAGQTVFPYGYNVSSYVHRWDEPTLTVSKNAVALAKTDFTIDTATGTITLATAAAADDVIVATNSEWAPRGILCDGQGGSVNDMGTITGLIMLACAIGLHARGGAAGFGGVEYLELNSFVIDTMSFACLVLEDASSVRVVGGSFTFAPYPVVLGSRASANFFSGFTTGTMPTACYLNPADRPNRFEITADAASSQNRVSRDSWNSRSGFTVNALNRVLWGASRDFREDGSKTSPALSFRNAPTSGFYRNPVTGAVTAVIDGADALYLSPNQVGVSFGASGTPALAFSGTTSGLRRDGGGTAAKDRWQVDGVDKWFWGINDVGVIGVPLRLSTLTLAALNGLSGQTNGQISYSPNGGAAAAPAVMGYVNGSWDYMVRGADFAPVATQAAAALPRDGAGEMSGPLKVRLSSTRYVQSAILSYANTTNATPAKAGLTGNDTAPPFTMPELSAALVVIEVVAITAGGSTGAWRITGALNRWASGTTIVGTSTVTPVGVAAGLASAVVQLLVDLATGGVTVQVTGIAASVFWHASMSVTVQVRP
jgi:hypothetical protein